MTVPTITSIDPASGLTRGGNMVTITGTGFREPPDPPSGPTSDLGMVSTVSVQFGGVESPYAHVITTTEVIARVPAWDGSYKSSFPVALNVRLANLDDDGNEIAGENVTEAAGYSVDRPSFVGKNVVQLVLERFVELLRQHVHPNVHFTTEREYYDYSEGIPDRVKEATLPLIHINGIDTPENDLARQIGHDPVWNAGDSDLVDVYERPTTVDLEFMSIDVWSNAKHLNEIFGLAMAMVNFFRDFTLVTITADASDTENTEHEHPLRVPAGGMPTYEMGPTLEGLKTFRMQAVIESVDMIERGGTLVDVSAKVDSTEIIEEKSE